MTKTTYPEITQSDLDAHKSKTGLSEMAAWNDLTIGKTFIQHRQAANSMSAERITITHRFSATVDIDVRVEGPERSGFRIAPKGSINWPGWGAQDPDTTEVFADMLLQAAEIAPTLAPRKIEKD